MSVRVVLTAVGAALLVAGCALVSDPPAEQLYRFGASPGVAASPVAASEVPRIRLGVDPGNFPREANGIRILTTEGARVSYLAQARWAAPADSMFETALLRAFDGAAPDVSLYSRGGAAAAQALLRTDVTQFEAVYDQGATLAPIVRIRATVRLTDRAERTVIGERDFSVETRATDNRVAAVVAAYDQAVSTLTQSIAGWSVDTARRGGVGARTAG